MSAWFSTSWPDAAMIAVSAIGIYAAVILFTRIVGLRSFSKMSSFDFAMTIAVGSIIASTLLSDDPSLGDGAVGLAAIYALQFIVSRLRLAPSIAEAIDNRPILLMEEGRILDANLSAAGVTRGDLVAKLREANVLRREHVRAVVLESTGDISVLHASDEGMRLEDWLLEGVGGHPSDR